MGINGVQGCGRSSVTNVNAQPAAMAYSVKEGENIRVIAQRYTGDTGNWDKIIRWNREKKHNSINPDNMKPGQIIYIPTAVQLAAYKPSDNKRYFYRGDKEYSVPELYQTLPKGVEVDINSFNSHLNKAIKHCKIKFDPEMRLALYSLCEHESNFQADQIGSKGEIGLFQILPECWPKWAEEAKLQFNAPYTIDNQFIVAAHKFAEYTRIYKRDWKKIFGAWNGGHGAVQKKLKTGTYPGSTGQYIDDVRYVMIYNQSKFGIKGPKKRAG